jgi:hypothetical protein
MHFRIDGITSDEGKDTHVTVKCDSEDDAVAKARALGILPYSVSQTHVPPPEYSQSPANSAPPNNEPVFSKPLTGWGWVLIIGGLCVAAFFLFLYDTTVYADGRHVHNIGLQQNRTLGAVAGMIAAAVGAIMVALDALGSQGTPPSGDSGLPPAGASTRPNG